MVFLDIPELLCFIFDLFEQDNSVSPRQFCNNLWQNLLIWICLNHQVKRASPPVDYSGETYLT